MVSFVFVFFEFERAFMPLVCISLKRAFLFPEAVCHLFFFCFFSVCVFCKAVLEHKLCCSCRKIVTLGVISSFYVTFVFSVYQLNVALERCKLLVWCFYFLTLRQFFVLIDRKKILNVILTVIVLCFAARIVWSCRERYGEHVCYQANWSACFLCFLGCFFFRMLPLEIYRWLACLGLSSFLVHELRLGSFICATFVVPFFVLRKRYSLVLFIVIGLLFIYKVGRSESIHNVFVDKIKVGILKQYINSYLKATGSWDLLLHGKRDLRVEGTHNLYATMVESFGVLEIIVFWVVFLKYFDLAFSTLLLFYGLVMTSPLYFFIAFYLCWQKQKLPSYQEETL